MSIDHLMVLGFGFGPTTAPSLSTSPPNQLRVVRLPLLLKSSGPEGVIGRWNAPGGRMEVGETPEESISREYLEEVGIKVDPEDWKLFHYQVFNNGVVLMSFVVELSKEEVDNCFILTDNSEPVEKQILTVSSFKSDDISVSWRELKTPYANDLLELLQMAWAFLSGKNPPVVKVLPQLLKDAK